MELAILAKGTQGAPGSDGDFRTCQRARLNRSDASPRADQTQLLTQAVPVGSVSSYRGRGLRKMSDVDLTAFGKSARNIEQSTLISRFHLPWTAARSVSFFNPIAHFCSRDHFGFEGAKDFLGTDERLRVAAWGQR